MKRWMVLALACSASLAHVHVAAQTATPASPAKKELISKLLTLQQAGVDDMARTIAQTPVINLGQQAAAALQTVPAEKRDAVAKTIDADLKKFLEETAPLIKERTTKLAPLAISPILEEKLTEDELKQIIAWIESPVRKKYEALSPEMRTSLGQRVLADVSPSLNPKLAALQERVVSTLRAAGAKIPKAPAPAASGAKPAAKAASK